MALLKVADKYTIERLENICKWALEDQLDILVNAEWYTRKNNHLNKLIR